MTDRPLCIQCGQPLTEQYTCADPKCILQMMEQSPDDLPLLRDYRQRKIVEMATAAADRVIMDLTNGTEEETAWLTSAVALRFTEKAHGANAGRLMRSELLNRAATR